MPLVIVESPNKCPKIKKVLGADYVVKASVGHIFDLDKKDNGVDLENWKPIYVPSPDKKDVISSLKEEAAKHDVIYIASDGDREGENIGFSIYDILPKKGKKIHRVVFNQLTKDTIEKAIKNPIGFNEKLNEAQQTRRILDRLIGFKFSPVLWSKGLKGTSAGRVQSVVLNWIVSLEKEIKSFKKEEYWSIQADLKDFVADFYGTDKAKIVPKSKEETDKILSNLTKQLTVIDYQAKTRSRAPAAPYITATLQQDATSKLNWPAKKVMDVAQELFSKGLITYLRTDSTRIDPDKLEKIREEISDKFGEKYLPKEPRFYKNSDAAQDAHEAILYTGEPIPASLSGEEHKLLDLIKARAIASQMTDAEYDSTSITLETQNTEKYQFKVNGSIQTFDGFTKVYSISSKELILPKLNIGDKLSVKEYLPEQHFTKPPARFSETSIVSEMKKTEVGRPSTYVSSIETLVRHNYIVKDKATLKPTEIGILVSDFLESYYNDIVNTNFTANMEKKLDLIEAGKIKKEEIMSPFYNDLLSKIDFAKKNEIREVFTLDMNCPSCKESKMRKRIANGEVFLSCENWPKCGETMNYQEDGTLVSSKASTGLPCPECGGLIVEKTGKYGKFYACENYKTCTWKGKVENGEVISKKPIELTEHKCPLCSKNMKKIPYNGKFFLGCPDYPKCKGTISLDDSGNPVQKNNHKLTNETCPKCKKGKFKIIEKDGNKFKACNRYPSCKNTEKM